MSSKGFSLVEIMLAVVILAVAIVPLVSAYGPAVFSTGGQEEMTVFSQRARGTLARICSLDYETLKDNMGNPADLAALFGSAEEAAKETFAFRGISYTPTVVIQEETPGQEGLLEIIVTLSPVSLKTLKADY